MKKFLSLATLLGVSTAILGAATLHPGSPAGRISSEGTVTSGTDGGCSTLSVVPLPLPNPDSPFPPAASLNPLPLPNPDSPFPPAASLSPLPLPNPDSPFPPAASLNPLPLPNPDSPFPPAR
jgi:hypothetical protein